MKNEELERHRCLIRWILALTASKGKKAADEYFSRFAKRHGDNNAEKLRAECREQWKLGNRGDFGDWR